VSIASSKTASSKAAAPVVSPKPKWRLVQADPPSTQPQASLKARLPGDDEGGEAELGGLTPKIKHFLALVQRCIDMVQALEAMVDEKERNARGVFADWHLYNDNLPAESVTLLGKSCCLCVTTLNRNEQVQIALPIAIWLAWGFADVTLHLVDFNQDTFLQQWVVEHLALPMEMGKLKYYRCPMATWHASLAKNTSHMAACLDAAGGLTPAADEDALLVNLDGDNLFTVTWLRRLLREDGPALLSKDLTVVPYNNVWDSGTYGRLAYLKSQWLGVRGYDVEFLPSGCQDTDLKLRLGQGKKGIRDVKHWDVGISIPNAPRTGNKKSDREEHIKAINNSGHIT
jgi:hypothetical protein